jgi:Cu/Ag efflux protein CusF
VHLYGTGVGDVTLTKAQIEAVAPGAITNTQIIIDSTLIAGLAEADSIVVRADAQNSAVWVIPPTITLVTLDAPAAGDVTIDGAGLDGSTLTTVRLYGAGVGDVTLTKAQIVAVAPGAVGAAQIIIDATLIAGLASGDNIVVTVDGTSSVATPVP